MFDVGGGELLLILIVILIAFGPRKLPELAKSFGRGMREFRRAQREFTDQFNTAIQQEERRQARSTAPPPPDATVVRDMRPAVPGPTDTVGIDHAPAAHVVTSEAIDTPQQPAPLPPDDATIGQAAALGGNSGATRQLGIFNEDSNATSAG